MTQISIQENIIIKTYYNNVQNKWQEKYANWFLKLIKKNVSKITFSRNSEVVYFQWMILIYL